MFNWFKKEKPPKPPEIRDTLFGDRPLSEWPQRDHANAKFEPWSWFVQARSYLEAGNKPSAIAVLQKITEAPALESRHYLQAWSFLRPLGVTPPEAKAKVVYGVVVEVGMDEGLDLLAAYMDHTARYYNYTGAGVIWEAPDHSLNGQIDDLLREGQTVVYQIGPWEEARPAPPPHGYVRLSMLTPSGLHFGQGDFGVLANDPMGGPLITAATTLMQSLIKKDPRISK
jgi:hypothetical protein